MFGWFIQVELHIFQTLYWIICVLNKSNHSGLVQEDHIFLFIQGFLILLIHVLFIKFAVFVSPIYK